MNRDRIEGQLKQLKGRAVEQWGHLTGDDQQVAEGRRTQMKGKLRERLGEAKEAAKDAAEQASKKVGDGPLGKLGDKLDEKLDQWKDQVDSVWKKN